MPAIDPLELWDWSEREWLRQNGVRRHPNGRAYYAETRGGKAPPLPVSAHATSSGWWELRMKALPLESHPELRAALAALLRYTAVDANVYTAST